MTPRNALLLSLVSAPAMAQCGLDWTAPPASPGFAVAQLHLLATGDLVATGNPTPMQWDGSTWSVIPAPVGSFLYGDSFATPTGDVVFGQLVGDYLRWDGSTWTAYAPSLGTAAVIYEKGIVLQNGDLVIATPPSFTVGGIAYNGIARFDGVSWLPLGLGVNGVVRRLIELDNGDLVVAGGFTTADGVPANGIARWDGTAWSGMGAGVAAFGADMRITAFTLSDAGALVAVASHNAGGRGQLGIWTGATWAVIPSPPFWGDVADAEMLPNGDVLVTGLLLWHGQPQVPAGNILRWDGASWQTFGAGLGPQLGPGYTLLELPDGTVAIGGDFATAGLQSSPFFALLRSTCPATATASGAGCAGSGGTLALVPERLPWVGSVSTSRVDNLAPGAVAAGVLGFGTSAQPLAQIHASAGAGCQLLVTPDATLLLGSPQLSLTIPPAAGLVGVTIHSQVLQGEFAGGSLALLTSSNRVTLQIGNL